MHRHLLPLCAPLLLALPAAAQGGPWGAKMDLYGPHADAALGADVAMLGDVNGDGTPDLAATDNWLAAGTAVGGGWTRVYSGQDGSLIWEIQDAAPSVSELKVKGLGDLNGDGLADFAVGNYLGEIAGGISQTGAVTVYSGADASVIWQAAGLGTWEYFGGMLHSYGDYDGDGLTDLLVGATGASGNSGSITLLAGADGSVIQTYLGNSSFSGFGTAVASPGDLDGDGYGDLVIGLPNYDNLTWWAYDIGRIEVVSGQTGALLYAMDGVYDYEQLGAALAELDDMTGDGVPDFAATYGDAPLGSVRFFSGANGAQFGSFLPAQYNVSAGLARAGDTNGDGYSDLVNSSAGPTAGSSSLGMVRIISGQDGSLIYEDYGDGVNKAFGTAVTGGQDIDGDGSTEVLVGSYLYASDAGMIRVLGIEPWLTASALTLSAANGGLVDYAIDFPADAAGDTYQLLASASGAGPTMLPGGVPVPLTLDTWLASTFLGSYPSAVLTPVGTLDAAGDGASAIQIPAGVLPASMIGATFRFAAVCTPNGSVYRYASSSVPLEFVP